MNVYYNAEYTGINSNASLISMGLVAETGEALYLEFLDTPSYLMDAVVKNDILPETYLYSETELQEVDEAVRYGEKDAETFGYTYDIVNQFSARVKITKWFEKLLKDKIGETIQIVTYCGHYDMCLLVNLFNGCPPATLNSVPYDIIGELVYIYHETGRPLCKETRYLMQKFSQFIDEDFGEIELLKGTPLYPKKHALQYAQMIKSIHENINK